MVKYSKRRYNKSKRRYNKSKRRYSKSKRRYNKSKRRYNKSKRRYNKSKRRQRGGADLLDMNELNMNPSMDPLATEEKKHIFEGELKILAKKTFEEYSEKDPFEIMNERFAGFLNEKTAEDVSHYAEVFLYGTYPTKAQNVAFIKNPNSNVIAQANDIHEQYISDNMTAEAKAEVVDAIYDQADNEWYKWINGYMRPELYKAFIDEMPNNLVADEISRFNSLPGVRKIDVSGQMEQKKNNLKIFVIGAYR